MPEREPSQPPQSPQPLQLWHPAAEILEQVVPVVQRRTIFGLTVVLSYLEIHADGNGYLRFLVRWTACPR